MAKTHTTFFKYAIVGTLGTAIDLGSLYLFVDLLHIHLLLSTALSFFLAVINNFILNKFWTFQNKSSNVRKQFIKFLIVSTTGLFLTEICMAIFVYGLKIWYMASKLITSGLVLDLEFSGQQILDISKTGSSMSPAEINMIMTSASLFPHIMSNTGLEKTLMSINSYFSDRPMTRQIIVVDDGSSDKTVECSRGPQERNKRVECHYISSEPRKRVRN